MLESVRAIILRLANETGWGYGRILGELKKLRRRSRTSSRRLGSCPGPRKARVHRTNNHVATRRVYCSPCCFQPNTKWMARQVEVFLDHARSEGLRVEHVTRDRDGMFVNISCDAILKQAGVRVITTAPHVPKRNAYVERWIQSIKSECLRYFIVCGQRHFDFLVSSYLEFFDTVRPHQGVGNRPLADEWREVDGPLVPGEHLVCHSRLGGLLPHYERKAA
jgi:putative transposase